MKFDNAIFCIFFNFLKIEWNLNIQAVKILEFSKIINFAKNMIWYYEVKFIFATKLNFFDFNMIVMMVLVI